MTPTIALSWIDVLGIEAANSAYTASNFDEAMQQFLKLEKSNPRNPEILQKIAELHLLENNARMATAYYKKAIDHTSTKNKIWPGSVELYLNIALAYYRDDKFSETAEYLGKASGPLGIALIEELEAEKKQLELFSNVTPYTISGDRVAKIHFEQLDPLPVIKLRFKD